MGGTPGTGHVSVRSYNRNFLGRSGNKNAQVYLMNPLLCALFAVRGEFVDPMETDVTVEEFGEPDTYLTNDNMLVPPPKDRSGVEIVKGPNIKEVSIKAPPGRDIEAPVLLALGDNITTDDIMPAGSKILPLRSNIPAISDYVFHGVDPEFSSRARAATGGFIVVGGENYGQGSSREHAAIAPMHLGLQAVIAKSFARIHRSNLINFGVLPLVFRDKADLDRIGQGDRLRIKDLRGCLQGGSCAVDNLTKGYAFEVESNLNEREAELVEKGGLLAHMRSKGA
jgi:aconitate hydratase